VEEGGPPDSRLSIEEAGAEPLRGDHLHDLVTVALATEEHVAVRLAIGCQPAEWRPGA
jgi:hypothetical protein